MLGFNIQYQREKKIHFVLLVKVVGKKCLTHRSYIYLNSDMTESGDIKVAKMFHLQIVCTFPLVCSYKPVFKAVGTGFSHMNFHLILSFEYVEIIQLLESM